MNKVLSLMALGLSSVAFSQMSTGFEASEGYAGSASGTLIAGQNGWYNPVAGSAEGFVFTYVANSLGMVTNASGGDQFLGNVTNIAATGIVSRAQHDVTFGGGVYTATYDFCPMWTGAPPSNDNLGSFSLQPSTTANYFQTLYHWPDFNNPTTFTMDYGIVDAAGLPSGTAISVFFSPGPEWVGLPINNWYRCSTTWDFATNKVISVSIQNLTTGGVKTTVNPVDWYLAGGANNVQARPAPTAVRFFSGGSTNGNSMGYDNFSVGPAATTETLAPTAEQIVFGTTNSGGNLASWAADDNNGRKVCRFFIPNAQIMTRMRLTYATTKTAPTGISFNVKISAHTPVVQQVTLRVENKVTNLFVDTNVVLVNIVDGTTYNGVPTGTLSNYVGGAGAMRGEIEIKQVGITALAFPCTTFEFAQMAVTG